MGLLTLEAIFSMLDTTNADMYAQEFNPGTPGDDNIESGDRNDFNVGQGGDVKIDSGDGDDTNPEIEIDDQNTGDNFIGVGDGDDVSGDDTM
jgi:hypothetical protein